MKSSLTVATTVVVVFAVSSFAVGQGVDSSSPELPPDGVYIAPHDYMQYIGVDFSMTLDDPVLRPLVATAVREPIGNDEIETFSAEFGAVWLGVESVALAGPVQVLTYSRSLSTTGTFSAEIVSMHVSGATSSGEIVLRESPAHASTGVTAVIDLGGGLYHIDSFFDVFTELSVDGGNSWIAGQTSTRMHLVEVAPESDGLDTDTAALPPDGAYVGPEERQRYPLPDMTLVLEEPVLLPDVATAQRTTIGNDEIEVFEARFEALETGQDLGPVVFTGPVEVVTRSRALSTAGSFDAEIVSMSLTGHTSLGLIVLREPGDRASTGVTDIIDLGGGLYHIDSFFDVFTELSVDGGNTWSASDTSMHLYLVPKGAPCPEDVDGNNGVDFNDLLRVLSAWGPCGVPCPEDVSGNGAVDFADLLRVLSAWGPCP